MMGPIMMSGMIMEVIGPDIHIACTGPFAGKPAKGPAATL